MIVAAKTICEELSTEIKKNLINNPVSWESSPADWGNSWPMAKPLFCRQPLLELFGSSRRYHKKDKVTTGKEKSWYGPVERHHEEEETQGIFGAELVGGGVLPVPGRIFPRQDDGAPHENSQLEQAAEGKSDVGAENLGPVGQVPLPQSEDQQTRQPQDSSAAGEASADDQEQRNLKKSRKPFDPPRKKS